MEDRTPIWALLQYRLPPYILLQEALLQNRLPIYRFLQNRLPIHRFRLAACEPAFPNIDPDSGGGQVEEGLLEEAPQEGAPGGPLVEEGPWWRRAPGGGEPLVEESPLVEGP